MLTSHHFPAWYLGTFPDRRVMLASYEADFAASWGRKARMVLEEHGQDLYGVKISKASSAADRWDIEGRLGGMQTAGVGGPLTGKGADLLAIDDPIKNSEEAASETMRDKQWDWFRSTAYTRLEPDGAAVLIQTRWNEDDLAGRIIAEMKDGGEKWEVLNLPALAEAGDPLGRQVGAALWPERYPVNKLETIRRTVGSRVWTSLYQQRPSPEDGDVFKREWFRFFHTDGETISLPGYGVFKKEDLKYKFLIVDLAVSEKKTADFTVAQVWGVAPKVEGQKNRAAVLFDQERGRFPGHELVDRISAMAKRWGCDWVGVESVGFQLAMVHLLKAKGIMVKALRPKGDKIHRAETSQLRLREGLVYFPDPKLNPWVDDLQSELLAFPNAAHDDQVDALTYTLLDIDRMYGPVAVEAA
jgi:predicted phage terminase large subunit-like protein